MCYGTGPCPGTDQTPIDPALRAAIQEKTALFLSGAPNWLWSRETGDNPLAGAVPRWPLGLLRSVLANRKALSSRKGLVWFLRCDYSLGLEPFRSFILSDLHLDQLGTVTAARIEECGMTESFGLRTDLIPGSGVSG